MDRVWATILLSRLRIQRGQDQFILSIPVNFSHDLVRGRYPQLLLVSDTTDPVAMGSAIAAMNELVQHVFNQDWCGSLQSLRAKSDSVVLVNHAKYNPLAITCYNIVLGLLGVVITLTISMIIAMALTQEYESGTIESLLATPIKPLEVMLSKTTPYVALGLVQSFFILLDGYLFFFYSIGR